MLDELHDEALANWQRIAEDLDAHVETSKRAERMEDLVVEARLTPDIHLRSVLSARVDALEAGATVTQVDAEASLLAQIRSLAHRAVTHSDWPRVAQAVAALETGQPLEERTVAM